MNICDWALELYDQKKISTNNKRYFLLIYRNKSTYQLRTAKTCFDDLCEITASVLQENIL